ncbi:MAG: InlB B-repeat-containing protein, partial [Mycobacterium sp.]
MTAEGIVSATGAGTCVIDLNQGGDGNYSPAAQVVVTATFFSVTYTISFDPSGGSGTMSDETFTSGVSQALTSVGYTNPGFTFAGWSATPGGAVEYFNHETIAVSSSATIYAVWTANTYTISFDPNGGSGSMSDETFTSGVSQALTSVGYTNPGFTFAGWSAIPGGAVEYFNHETITVSASATIYAVWTPVAATYTVSFNANGGTGSMSSESFTGGVGQALTTNAFTRSGYTFAGWGTASGGPVAYSDGQTITVSTSQTLYAQWTAIATYKVTFNANGGSGSMSSENFTSGVPKALKTNTFTRSNYTFAGWGTTPSGPVVYFDAETVTIAASVTLYAIWTPVVVNYTVSFNANGGT